MDYSFNDNTKVFLYNDNLNIDNIYNRWIDSYKVGNKVYTILKISDNCEILEIPKNI